MDLREHLLQLQANLNILQEREAKFGHNVPLELVNQITDHKTAVGLTEQALAGEIDEAEWREALRPLLVVMRERTGEAAVNLTINIHEAAEPSPGPPNTRFWRWVVSVGILVAIVAGVVQIMGVDVLDLGAYLAADRIALEEADETLIVIATFHETAATKSEPHIKIKRAIEEVAKEVGLETLRVEVEPTVLRADERDEAEALGQQYDASIIIWGEDTGVQVLVNFLNLKEPDSVAAEVLIDELERTQYETQFTNPSAYREFILDDLPGQLTFLSFFAVGQSFYVTEQYVQAKDIIEQGIEALSNEAEPEGLADAYFGLGWLYMVPLKDLKKAIANFDQTIELDPEYAGAYGNRGIIYAEQGDLEAAVAHYNRVIELNPEDALAYTNRGSVYRDQGDLTAAIADYDRAIELDPDYALAYNNRGIAYYKQGDLTAAITDYDRAIELNPEDALAYTNRGIAYRERGDLEAAITDYDRAIELDPEYAEAYNNRGIAYYKQGDLTAAITDYDRAIELDPEYAEAYYNRGLSYAALDQIEKAIVDFEQGMALDTAGTYHEWARDQLEALRRRQGSPEAGD